MAEASEYFYFRIKDQEVKKIPVQALHNIQLFKIQDEKNQQYCREKDNAYEIYPSVSMDTTDDQKILVDMQEVMPWIEEYLTHWCDKSPKEINYLGYKDSFKTDSRAMEIITSEQIGRFLDPFDLDLLNRFVNQQCAKLNSDLIDYSDESYVWYMRKKNIINCLDPLAMICDKYLQIESLVNKILHYQATVFWIMSPVDIQHLDKEISKPK